MSGALEQQFGIAVAPGRTVMPFLEHDGQYWGAAPDAPTASNELDRMRRGGAQFVAFAWTGFWWLGHYTLFHEHLRAHFPCVLENERLVIFDFGDARRAS